MPNWTKTALAVVLMLGFVAMLMELVRALGGGR
jgi:hypothetical protein